MAPQVRRRARALLTAGARFARDRWFSIDLRTLGLFRIGFGICLIANLCDHAAAGGLTVFFSNDGVLTNHYALFAPIQQRVWSLLFAFSRPGEVGVAFGAILAVYVLYTVGWKTKLMQILVIVCFISLVNRNLLLQDGGSFVTTILTIWTAFLPLGARFSIDRWRAGSHLAPASGAVAPPEPAPRHVSFVCLALWLQLAAIYGLNGASKTGAAWHDGTAIHYILWQNGYNTRLAGLLRFHEPHWLSPFFTRGTLIFEYTAPLLVLAPIWQTVCRRVLMASMWSFHLGIAAFMTLGPFAWGMIAYSLLLLGPDDWKLLRRLALPRLWSRRRRAQVARWSRRLQRVLGRAAAGRRPWAGDPLRDEAVSPAGPVVGRGFVGRAPNVLVEGASIVLFVAMLAELTLANAVIAPRYRWESRPQWMAELVYYLRIYQTWSMFAPDPPADSGRIVVDAILTDGSHLDPLTGKTPDFAAPLGGPFLLGHDWAEYMLYFPWDRHRPYRIGFRDYIAGLDRAGDWPADRHIRSFDVYWTSAQSPRPGQTELHDLKRELMISSAAPP